MLVRRCRFPGDSSPDRRVLEGYLSARASFFDADLYSSAGSSANADQSGIATFRIAPETGEVVGAPVRVIGSLSNYGWARSGSRSVTLEWSVGGVSGSEDGTSTIEAAVGDTITFSVSASTSAAGGPARYREDSDAHVGWRFTVAVEESFLDVTAEHDGDSTRSMIRNVPRRRGSAECLHRHG